MFDDTSITKRVTLALGIVFLVALARRVWRADGGTETDTVEATEDSTETTVEEPASA
ncbi:hypothetical protein [Haloarchaeobius baliensis]|uniref:hypothetical protein n=1 Tax=Haloarchaeobius baliensis TaxID=1670458 RepID=UPI003F882B2B